MPKFKPIHLHLLVAFCLHTTTRAEWWDDFSNNLATDLAPLLALFGERVTMQFLSESTSWLDNFIFAMAPLGVVTAVVSAIRVCGGPGLRAFIGRAQEGGGIAEAELCSSTSRDVCELYHNGAIVRVFGRPKILEVVHDSKADDFYHQFSQSNELQEPRCGIYTFREYVEDTEAGKNEWKECGVVDQKDRGSDVEQRGSSSGNDRIPIWQRAKTLWCFNKRIKVQSKPTTNLETSKRATFAPNPNLSFNIGIKKHRQFIPWLAAGIGLIVQTSVTLFGGLATYFWQWEKDGARPQVWAFPLMAAGTMLLSCGMFGCAYMVERSTKERRFRKVESKNPSLVYVTQPGNQTIGDQTYDPFAFSDTSPSEPVKEYITSWKTPPQENDKIKVWVAIGLTVVGFGLQFTGLRAMHSSVSVVLLAAILIMSIIRSALRTGRLKREQNLLCRQPDQVIGHELDWLAMQMRDGESWSHWSFISTLPHGQMSHREETVVSVQSQEGGKEVITKLEMTWGSVSEWPIICAFAVKKSADLQDQETLKALMKAETRWLSQNDLDRREGSNKGMTDAARLFYYRSRLAEMTWPAITNSPSRLSTEWDDTLIPLRQQLRQLKAAMESSAQLLFANAEIKPAWREIKSFCWTVNVAVRLMEFGEMDMVDPIHMFLRKPNLVSGKQSTSWTVDHKYLEAALGLSVWSMVSDSITQKTDDLDLKLSTAAEIPRYRIIANGYNNKSLHSAEKEFKYWMNKQSDPTSKADLSHYSIRGRGPHSINRSPSAIWVQTGEYRGVLSPCHKFDNAHLFINREPLFRFFGWPDSTWSRRWNGDPGLTEEVLFLEAKHSMTTLCAQDIYQRFIGAMAMILDSIGGHTSLNVDNNVPCISNDVISKLVDSIRECGLGSRQDAYAMLVPALGKVLPTMADVLPEFCSIASDERSTGNFEKAEAVLKHGYEIGLEGLGRDQGNSADSDQGLKMIILELAELYRIACRTGLLDQGMQSLRRKALETLGLKGIDWLEEEKSEGKRPLPTVETIDRYFSFGQRWRNQNSFEPQKIFTTAEVMEAFTQYRRDRYFFGISRVRNFVHSNSSGRDFMSLASENGWLESVNAMIHMGSKVDAEDALKRTALSYASQHGHTDVVDALIRSGANPDAKDLNGRTPLSHASENGQVQVMRRLLNEADVPINAMDSSYRTPLHWAVAGDHISSVELLLEKKADLEAYDEDGQTPYIMALRRKQAAAELRSPNRAERTTQSGQRDVAKLLLKKGAKLTPRIGQQDAWKWAFQNGKWNSGNFMLQLWSEAREMPAKTRRVVVLVQLISNSGTHDKHMGQLLFDPHPEEPTSFVVCEMDENGMLKRADSATLYNVLQVFHHHEVWIYEFNGPQLVGKDKLVDPQHNPMDINRTRNPICTQRDKVKGLLSFLPPDTQITADMCQAVAQNSVGLGLYSKDHLETMGLLLKKGGLTLRDELRIAMETMEGYADLRSFLQRMDCLSL